MPLPVGHGFHGSDGGRSFIFDISHSAKTTRWSWTSLKYVHSVRSLYITFPDVFPFGVGPDDVRHSIVCYFLSDRYSRCVLYIINVVLRPKLLNRRNRDNRHLMKALRIFNLIGRDVLDSLNSPHSNSHDFLPPKRGIRGGRELWKLPIEPSSIYHLGITPAMKFSSVAILVALLATTQAFLFRGIVGGVVGPVVDGVVTPVVGGVVAPVVGGVVAPAVGSIVGGVAEDLGK